MCTQQRHGSALREARWLDDKNIETDLIRPCGFAWNCRDGLLRTLDVGCDLNRQSRQQDLIWIGESR